MIEKNLLIIEKLKPLLERVRSIKNSVYAFLAASLIDILAITAISILYERLSVVAKGEMWLLVVSGLLIVLIRTSAVYYFRRYAYIALMAKKTADEYTLVHKFVRVRSNTPINEENRSVARFKESIMNSTQLAAINFDLPFTSLAGEVLFGVGGVAVLVYNVGFTLILGSLPIVIVLIFAMKIIADRLKSFGAEVLNKTENRIRIIDNISEASLELSISDASTAAAKYFDRPNAALNKLYATQQSVSNSIQLIVESASFVIIMFCVVLVALGVTSLSMGGIAAALVILARMVPTITRSIASVTQLHYGIPAVVRLYAIRNGHAETSN